jgi:histidinol-phosphatase (PHP family)
VAIRFGVEVTWERRFEEAIRDHLARHAYDFVIGSVHVYRGSPYAAPNVGGWVAGRSLPEIVRPYFEEVEAGARSGLFDALGHLDFVKRYLVPHVTAADLAAAPELYEPMLRALVESGTALEVNTSGLRQAARETYPSPSIVARFRELGGSRVSVGSDAHGEESFAWGLQDGYDAASGAGFHALTFRRGGAPVEIAIGTGRNATVTRSL